MKKLIVSCLLILSAGCASSGVEEPAFQRVLTDGAFEIRDYAPTILAETTVTGDALGSRFAGFGPLADYIFAKDRQGKEIAMTAPVTQVPNEQIAMTAPVTQQLSKGSWVVGFTMPAEYTMASLPRPSNPNVKLVEQAARRMAVLTFSGPAGEDHMKLVTADLMARVAKAGLTPKGEPVFAFYDPPWTLAFLRRNEVMVEIEGTP